MSKKINLFIKPFLKFFKNKYLVTISLFVVWVLFFDHNNLVDRTRLIHNVNQLEKDKAYYKERIITDSTRLDELTDPKKLEKFAREQFLMKNDNEDIFVIVEQ